MSEGAPRFPAVVLAACTLGLVFSLFLYMLAGAPADLPPAFSRVLLLGSAFLGWRYMSKPDSEAGTSVPIHVLELLSWVAVAAFLWIASGIKLLRGFERLERPVPSSSSLLAFIFQSSPCAGHDWSTAGPECHAPPECSHCSWCWCPLR